MPSNKSDKAKEIQRKIEQKWNEIDKELRQQTQEIVTANVLLQATPVLRDRKKMPSKTSERIKELRRKFEQKQNEVAEELRQRSQKLATETSLFGSMPISRLCQRQLELHPRAYFKIASIILFAIGIYGLVNNFTNSFIDNAMCSMIFPFNLICSKIAEVPKIVY